MKPSQQMAPTFLSAPPPTPRRKRGVAALLCLVLAATILIAATSAGAAPFPSCRADQAVYEGAAASAFEIEFFRDFTAKTGLVKSGVMRIHLETGVIDYDVLTGWSKQYARPDITIRRSAARTREGDRSPENGPSALMMFDADLRPHRPNGSAPAVLIMEEIPVGFHYWNEERERAFSGRRISPNEAFTLMRCRGARENKP
jgi:hypothetical protein